MLPLLLSRPRRRPLCSSAHRALLAVVLPALLSLLDARPVAAAPTAVPTSGPTAGAFSGAWDWPLQERPPLGRTFRPGVTRYAPGHRGVDLVGEAGAAVLAAGAGRVAYAGPLAGRGVVVVVHGGLRTTYEPVRASVRVGQRVTRGQRLGVLQPGHRDCPGEACLHWGLRRGREHLDPLRLVGGGRVRLLPVGPPVPLARPADAPAVAAAPARAESAARTSAPAAAAPAGGRGAAAAVPVLLISSAVLAAAAGRPR